MLALVLAFVHVSASYGQTGAGHGPTLRVASDPWWDMAWLGRTSLLLSPESGPLADVPIRLDLDASIVDWSHGGRDLRFVLVDPETKELRLLPHWLYTDRITDGAWFACCAFNDFEQYHTPAATYYTCLRPNAIHFEGRHDRT
ncbi:MAG: hypothetical protein KDA27_29165, partial [Candidatus Eisenbacteria bacterium]|nr:hypothetical protein [Candidatus Eisenbacteria bacterium]